MNALGYGANMDEETDAWKRGIKSFGKTMREKPDDKLSLIWDGRTKDFVANGPNGRDQNLVFYHLLTDNLKVSLDKKYPNNFEVYNFIKDLEDRGYDIKTLKFSIEKR